MNTTSKLITIDNNTGIITGYSSQGTLADHLHISRHTVVNWFREKTKIVSYKDYTIYKLDYYVSKYYPPRKK